MSTKLGQNFLIDKNIAEKEIEHADVNSDDVVLEIGPGKGVLTKMLSERAKKVFAIEIDEKLVKKLVGFLPDNVEIFNKDVMKVDFSRFPVFNKVVSNLPFQISSPVTFKLLEQSFDVAVLIYQKEFAQRMVARPGDKNYSRLSVNVFYKADCEIIQTVSKKCFSPAPKVDASMVKLIPRDVPPFRVLDEKLFTGVSRDLFNHRRKKIGTVLSSIYPDIDFKKLPFLECRVEVLSPEQIGSISDFIFTMHSKK